MEITRWGGFFLQLAQQDSRYRREIEAQQGQGPRSRPHEEEKRAGQSWGKESIVSPRTWQDCTSHHHRGLADAMEAADRDVRR